MKKRAALALCSALALSACGGGGGGDSAVAPAPAPASLAIGGSNYVSVAQQAVSSSLYFMDSADLVVGAQTSDGHAVTRFALAQVERVGAWFKRSPQLVAGATLTFSENCSGGGRLDVTIDDRNGNQQVDTGEAVALRAMNCVEDGETINGGIEMSITALNGVFGSASYTAGITLRLSALTATSPTQSVVGNGEMRLSVSASGTYSAMLTIEVPSFSVSGSLAGVSYSNSLNGFRLNVVKAPGGTLYTISVNISGSMSSSMLESKQISIETPVALVRNWSALDPDVGQLIVRGASGSKLRITAQSAGRALIELDADGNDIYEASVIKPWAELR